MKICNFYARDTEDAAAMYNYAMWKVFKNITQYKRIGSLMGWIRRIVVNTCIDHCRKRAKYAERELRQEHEQKEQESPSVYDSISGKEILEMIRCLPANTSLVFNLYVMEGFKHLEIAQRLGISEGTSKWHLSEARRLLKMKLESLLNKEFYIHAT